MSGEVTQGIQTISKQAEQGMSNDNTSQWRNNPEKGLGRMGEELQFVIHSRQILKQ